MRHRRQARSPRATSGATPSSRFQPALTQGSHRPAQRRGAHRARAAPLRGARGALLHGAALPAPDEGCRQVSCPRLAVGTPRCQILRPTSGIARPPARKRLTPAARRRRCEHNTGVTSGKLAGRPSVAGLVPARKRLADVLGVRLVPLGKRGRTSESQQGAQSRRYRPGGAARGPPSRGSR